MKAKKGFTLRNICGEQILLAEGVENIDFSDIISMNESSAYLWENIQGKTFTTTDLANLLTANYEVDEATAMADAATLAKQWIDTGIVEP